MTACTPATYDNLTGGQPGHSKDDQINPHSLGPVTSDPGLKAPRPISPLSVTWVNTLRPKFRWELQPGENGAVVELSKTRDFKGPIRTFLATGTELAIPDDVDRGIWFWRLRGRSEGAEGIWLETDAVWEVLVRGPSKSGVSSDVPGGHVSDLNGDGIPDLSFAAMTKPDLYRDENNKPYPAFPMIVTTLGEPDGTYQLANESTRGIIEVAHVDATFTNGSDVDGDGYPDMVVADTEPSGDPTYGDFGNVFVYHGGTAGWDDAKDQDHGWVSTPRFNVRANILLVGDVNGDGYGDLSVTLPGSGYTAFGGRNGLSHAPLMMFPSGTTGPSSPAANEPWRPIAGACDLDGDGFSEIAIASALPQSPITMTRGTKGLFGPLKLLTVEVGLATPQEALGITSGDFDGDGKAEFAFSTTVNGLPAVCFYSEGALKSENCWKSDVALTDFGVGIAAADIDNDGNDELLVTSSKGVAVIKHLGPGSFDVKWVLGSFFPSIAVIHPGRPEPARWAVVTTDRTRVQIFVGSDLKQELHHTDFEDLASVGPTVH